MTHPLYESHARAYDLHTPASHYQHDHAFVLERVRARGDAPRLLDVGCGTGVFLEKALAAGTDATGIDAAAGMIDVATARVGRNRARVGRMQDLDERNAYDAIVSLSWVLNYARDADELRDILRRLHRATRPKGLLVAQVAHAAHTDGEWMEDVEPGPGGAEDVSLRFRFEALEGDRLRATYVYRQHSTDDTFTDEHVLNVADARLVARLAAEAGWCEVGLRDSWRDDPFTSSVSVFLLARAS